jgi:hypothetical protein
MATISEHKIDINSQVAFKIANNILEKWGCSTVQMQDILAIPKSDLHLFQQDVSTIYLNKNQIERISYIANIHQTLKILFDNPDNIYGFMGMINNNHYFDGTSPLAIISDGSVTTLAEVFKHINSMVKK